MALHMVDDPDGQDDYVDDNSGGGGGGNSGGGGGLNIGGMLSFLPLVLGLFRGRGSSTNSDGTPNPGGRKGCSGKSLILLLIVAGLAYFFFFRGGCNGGGNTPIVNKLLPIKQKKHKFTKGLKMTIQKTHCQKTCLLLHLHQAAKTKASKVVV
jgi:hypothetical protein